MKTLLFELEPGLATFLLLLSIIHDWKWVCLLLFLALFYRDQERRSSVPSSILTSPCDGTVLSVTDEELVIFLSPLDMHTQKAVADCTVVNVTHTPGTFVPAMWLEKSRFNERVTSRFVLTNNTMNATTIEVDQIAGQIARRIETWISPNDVLQRGDTYGIIKFGSQCRVRVPHLSPQVRVGDRVWAGQTPIYRII